jgi:hypothetical protein
MAIHFLWYIFKSLVPLDSLYESENLKISAINIFRLAQPFVLNCLLLLICAKTCLCQRMTVKPMDFLLRKQQHQQNTRLFVFKKWICTRLEIRTDKQKTIAKKATEKEKVISIHISVFIKLGQQISSYLYDHQYVNILSLIVNKLLLNNTIKCMCIIFVVFLFFFIKRPYRLNCMAC